MELQSGQAAGLTTEQASRLRLQSGWNETVERKPGWVHALLIRFWGPSAWMIEAVVIISLFLDRLADASVAGVLLILNGLIGCFQEKRAERAVELLRRRLQVSTRVLRDGIWKTLSARELVPGDLVRLRLGDMVPADVRILEGELELDQSALTGESLDVRKQAGDVTYSGSLVRRGECTGVITAIGAKTYFGRTVELVQTAHPKLHLDEIVAKLVYWLVAAIGILLVIAFSLSLLRHGPLTELLPLSLVLLMGAVPVALPVMFSVSTALAAHELGKRGVLVTRLSAAEDAATMDMLFVDKTGTITQNRLSVVALYPARGVTETELLKAAAMASTASDQDPIDIAILRKSKEQGVDPSCWSTLKFVPFSPETRRTEAIVKEGEVEHTVTKGSVPMVTQWVKTDPFSAQASTDAEASAHLGYRSIAVGEIAGDHPRYLGLIALQDPPRPDSAELISKLHSMGIQVRMLTGDALPVAQVIASEIGLGTIGRRVSRTSPLGEELKRLGGLAEVYPDTKFDAVGALQAQNHIVGMTGDGVNDAPSLKRAEVGIAVSNATEAAKAAASVVLTVEGLSGIVDLIENGRAVYQRILTWTINKVSSAILKAGFVVIFYLLSGRLVISALGMLLIVFLTDFSKIALATDNVRVSSSPETWNVGPLAILGALIGTCLAFEGILALKVGSTVSGITFNSGELRTYAFDILLFLSTLSVLSIRERRYAWSSLPSPWLAGSLGLNVIFGFWVGAFGFINLPPIPERAVLSALVFSALCALVLNDLIKRIYLALFFPQGTSRQNPRSGLK